MAMRRTVCAMVMLLVTTSLVWGQGGLGQEGAAGPAGDAQAGVGLGGAQRIVGTVTAATAEQLTVKTELGEMYRIAVTPNTRYMKDRQPAQWGSIHVGDSVGAMGVGDTSARTLHAAVVMIVDAEQAKKAREGLGKVYIVGKITGIDEVKISVLRPDGVTQVIEVDEGTSFRRGMRGMGGFGGMSGGPGVGAGSGPGAAASGESITLADVKVGDSVMAQGALKGGVFVPTVLGVSAPGAGRQRRRTADGSAGGSSGGAVELKPTEPK